MAAATYGPTAANEPAVAKIAPTMAPAYAPPEPVAHDGGEHRGRSAVRGAEQDGRRIEQHQAVAGGEERRTTPPEGRAAARAWRARPMRSDSGPAPNRPNRPPRPMADSNDRRRQRADVEILGEGDDVREGHEHRQPREGEDRRRDTRTWPFAGPRPDVKLSASLNDVAVATGAGRRRRRDASPSSRDRGS